MNHSRWQVVFQASGLVLITVLAYLPCLNGPFLFDDVLIVEECPAIQASNGLSRLWFDAEMPNYEPLTYSVFWLGWQLWGDATLGYHLINLGLHVLVALLIWKVLERLEVPGAWLAGLLFAVHPVNVQSAAYIFQIRNTLSTALALAALLCWLRSAVGSRLSAIGYQLSAISRKRAPGLSLPTADSRQPIVNGRRWYVFALALFALALLSKAAVVMLPVLFLGIVWWQRGAITRGDVWQATPFFAAALVLGLTEVWFQNHRAIGTWNVRDEGLLERTLGAATAVWYYARTALAPINLMFIQPREPAELSSVFSYLPLAGIALAVSLLWRYRHSWGRHGLAAIGWFAIALLPVLGFLNIAFMRYSFVADHWQYLALPAPLGLVAGLGVHLANRARFGGKLVLHGLGIVVVCGLTFLTWQHATLFGNPEMLWRANYAKNPSSPMVCFSLGAELGKRGEHVKAERLYRKALALDPSFVEARVNLAASLLQRGDAESAQRHLSQALTEKPGSPRIRLNLAGALVRLGQSSEAILLYEPLLASRRYGAAAELGLGVACLYAGQADRAAELLARVVAAQPNDCSRLKLLADAEALRGRRSEAASYYRRALAAEPSMASAHLGLGSLAAEEGHVEQAVTSFKRALELQPKLAAAHGAWGELLAKQGKKTEARLHFTEALRIDANCVEAHAAIGDMELAEGRPSEAIQRYAQAVQLRPRHAELRKTLGDLLLGQQQVAEALKHYRAALELQSGSPAIIGRVAWLLATSHEPGCRDGKEAVALAEQLCKLSGRGHPLALDTLAAAYAEAGRFPEAVHTARQALDAAQKTGENRLVRELGQRLTLYERAQPFRTGLP
jgi:tetratricopeptide (TPR) repeat protein